MAQCVYCRTETQLYINEAPICVACAEGREQKAPQVIESVLTALTDKVAEARKLTDEAAKLFSAVITDVPSGMPHPDGTHRIQNASRQLAAARQELMKAHTRLNDFLNSGAVPEDIVSEGPKRSG
jgi:hypothetical protein